MVATLDHFLKHKPAIIPAHWTIQQVADYGMAIREDLRVGVFQRLLTGEPESFQLVREAAGVSRDVLGALIGVCGNSILKCEFGYNGPYDRWRHGWTPTVQALAGFLHVLPEDLFPEHDNRDRPEGLMPTEQVRALVERPVPDIELAGLEGQVDRALATIGPREEDVLRRRFGLHPYEGEQTLEEVAVAYGVTRERIRQMEAKGLRKLRHPSRANRLSLWHHVRPWWAAEPLERVSQQDRCIATERKAARCARHRRAVERQQEQHALCLMALRQGLNPADVLEAARLWRPRSLYRDLQALPSDIMRRWHLHLHVYGPADDPDHRVPTEVLDQIWFTLGRKAGSA